MPITPITATDSGLPDPHALPQDTSGDVPTAAPWVWLASRSPRRQELLTTLGVSCRLLLDEDDERAEALEAVLPGELPAAYVQRVALLKASAARSRLAERHAEDPGTWPDAPILCADTTVAKGGRILGKPRDADEARSTLTRLAGTGHRVLTAVVVCTSRRRHALTALSHSRVRFARLTTERIERYIATGEPFGKAGAYGIQGHAAAFIQSIEGSHSGIMGLPLHETAELLRRAGLLLPGS